MKIKSCLNCEHGEIAVSNMKGAYCYLDIGDYIEDPEAEAQNCRYYRDEKGEQHGKSN